MNLALKAPGLFLVCLPVAAALIYLPFLVVGYGRLKAGYDTSSPRAMFDKLPAYGQRATWAHQNGFESFIQFAPAALAAYVTGLDSALAVGAVIAYLIARTLYPLFYILDVPLLRSLMFGIGSLGIFTLFVLSCGSALI